MSPTRSTRRRVLQGIGAGGTVALLGGSTAVAAQEEDEEEEEDEEVEEEEEEVEEEEEDDEEEFAAIRFGHLSPGAPAVDVYVGKTPDLNPTVGELNYPAFGPGPNDGYLQVPPGMYNVAVTPDGETEAALDVEEVELEAGFRYSALAIGQLDEEMEEDENGIDEEDDEVGVGEEDDENGMDDEDENGVGDDENGIDDEDENGVDDEDDEVGIDEEDDEVGVDEADENDVDSATGLQPLIIADAGTMDEATPPEDQAEVSFVHASPDAGAVDIVIDGDALLEDVEFGDASDYFAVDPGEYDVAIEADGEAVLEMTQDLRAGTSITVYVTGIAEEAEPDDAGVAEDEEDDDTGIGEDDNGDTDDENGVEEDTNGLDDEDDEETDEDDLPGLSVVTTLDGTNPLADGVVTR